LLQVRITVISYAGLPLNFLNWAYYARGTIFGHMVRRGR